jgi:hypothetical protein
LYYVEQVKPALNGLFREEDYPSITKLRQKFGLKLEVLPVPSGDDFRVSMSAEERARVSREIDENVRQSLQKGTADLWDRLKAVVSHMANRLQVPGTRFHTSMVSNVFDLVDLLPKLNVGQDQELNRFAEEIRSQLCGYSAHELKNDDNLRMATANQAVTLLTQMDAVTRQREEAATITQLAPEPSADAIYSHMADYMQLELVTA